MVVSLIHPLKDCELEAIASTGVDVVLVDLRASLRARKRAEGKHFKRKSIVAEYQDKSFVECMLLDEGCPFKTWAANSKRASAEAESAERKRVWQEEREWERRKREKAEADLRARKRLEMERRQAALERQIFEQRAAKEAEEAERLAAEEAAREEAEKRSLIEIEEQLQQQEHQARDSLGRRWVRCEKCGKAKLADEFMIYGGQGRMNLGTCYECSER